MNPMTNVKNIKKLSELELKRNLKTSWHDQYKDSAWLFVGGLPYDLTEGDVICVFSQYGEVVNLNLVRDKATGKSKGFCFLCYEDQRSTVLAVDNLNGIKLLGRTIRVDHVSDYKPPKDSDKLDEGTRKLRDEGCASIPAPGSLPVKQEVEESTRAVRKEKKGKLKTKSKKVKKKRKKKKNKKQVSSSEESSSDSSETDSSSDSDSKSEDSVASRSDKKHKRSSKKSGKKQKKKPKVVSSNSDSSTENETIRDSREKRRKLVEKIKTLEAVLNYTRNAAKKTGGSEEPVSKTRSEELVPKSHDEKQRVQQNEKSVISERNEKQRNHCHENGTLGRKSNNSDDTARKQETDHDDRRWRGTEESNSSRARARSRSRSRDRFRSQERNREWEHDRSRTWDRERHGRERDKHWDKSYERGPERHRR